MRFRRLIAPPVFEEDEDKTRVAALLNVILLIVAGLVALYMLVTLVTEANLVIGLAIEGTMLLVALGLLVLMRRGWVRRAALILSLLLWGLITVGTYLYGGLRGSGIGSFFGVALIAGLLLGGRMGILFAILSILSAGGMLLTEILGVAPSPPEFLTPSYRWMEFSTTIIGVTGLAYLFTHSLERALEQAQRKSQEALEASQFKSRLIARISHELRTPLGAVMGLTEMLHCMVYGPLSIEQQEITQKVLRNSQRLNELVTELIEQSRFESGRFRLRMEKISPRDIVNRVASAFAPVVQEKGLAFAAEIADDVPDEILGDLNRVEQILSYLVNNAVKFTRTGSISVRAYRPNGDRWALQVVDTGLGIPKEAQAHVFEPFRQVDESMTREYDGLGLGLAIVKQLTGLMQGEITLESDVGRGSTFTVLLPMYVAADEPAEE